MIWGCAGRGGGGCFAGSTKSEVPWVEVHQEATVERGRGGGGEAGRGGGNSPQLVLSEGSIEMAAAAAEVAEVAAVAATGDARGNP